MLVPLLFAIIDEWETLQGGTLQVSVQCKRVIFVSSNSQLNIFRKAPHYISDFTDGFHPQCISSFLFLYFACLAPIVAFGALLGPHTGFLNIFYLFNICFNYITRKRKNYNGIAYDR